MDRRAWAALVTCVFAVACREGFDSAEGVDDGSGTDTGAVATSGATDEDDGSPGDGAATGSAGEDTAAASGRATTDSGPDDDADGSSDGGTTTGVLPPEGPVALCFWDDFVTPVDFGPDYDQFGMVPGSHCVGTNHQSIDGIERVVFLGDSITVGTPPALGSAYYRGLLADAMAERFGLSYGEGLDGELTWKQANPFTGQAAVLRSGDFAACARWGARNDDLLQDNSQIEQCFLPEDFERRTLVVFTSGGNDINAITQDAIDGVPNEDLWLTAEDMVVLQREAIEWLLEPGRFPNGVFVIFANLYEFTDGTGEVESCDVSGLAGFDQPVPAPDELADLVVWIEEEYGRMAVETGTDMIFLLEQFCGHGFNADDPSAPCYRGPGTEVWFDLTCIHPNATGHAQIAEMFTAVVDE